MMNWFCNPNCSKSALFSHTVTYYVKNIYFLCLLSKELEELAYYFFLKVE